MSRQRAPEAVLDEPEVIPSLFDGLMEVLAELDGLATLGPAAVLETLADHDLDELRLLQAWIPNAIAFLQEMDTAVDQGRWLSR